MEDNKVRQPLYLGFLILFLLLIVSFVKIDYEFWGLQIRQVDILADLKPEPIEDEYYNQNNFHPNIFELYPATYNYAGIGVFNEAPLQGQLEPLSGNVSQLKPFFDALKNAKSKTVRIAHYGDSGIEGDLITADVREALQDKFGGNGVGWLGITSQDISFRTTTKHSFSSNWESAAFYSSNPKNYPLGMSGECFVPKATGAWVQYETTRARRSLKDFSTVKLYYANAKPSTINYSFDGGAKQTVALKTGKDLQELVLKPSGRAKSIKIEVTQTDQAYFYGVSLENETGVYVDNLPLRGNTGVDLANIDEGLLKQFSKHMDYKLVVLEFGLNIAGTRKTDYSWYEREMVKVVDHVKRAFPSAGILMVTVQDKGMKKGTSFVSDPAILSLLEAQKNIAKQSNVAYWNLFEAMGGQSSMVKWVNANPPLAFKDYIHFNGQGAAKVAKLFTDALLDSYNKR
ncbi:MAG: GDSL-type esterase/lipase family protein [Melioribacteraceae bacterium]